VRSREAIPSLIVYNFDAPPFCVNSEYFLRKAREPISSAETVEAAPGN